jgi:hypothetical protein
LLNLIKVLVFLSKEASMNKGSRFEDSMDLALCYVLTAFKKESRREFFMSPSGKDLI